MTRELTGKHVLMICLAAFGVIIGVNVLMAVKAVSTFPGLEVKNSYVASQSFDRDRAAQDALHWTVTPEYDGRVLSLTIRDAQGYPARLQSLAVTIGRPTHVRDDQELNLTYQGGIFSTPLQLAPGARIIHLAAVAEDGTLFRQRIDHFTGARVR
ncbi:FixH family protein [Paracoccus sp. DMF-8]|uniref:FixH family protein n=1 Tax=Paracoccus sp. DMF-8 TaxID=3019445 RepID=UPI0023E7E256|nr:FixH family protein [Paracoccus sp. DMF-8]MDF3605546.1 FixH family protein [Paracoccus sp. DMF-8]